MAEIDTTVYTIIAPPDATLSDVQRMAVEIYLSEENPPENIMAESVGADPQGNSVWAVTIGDSPESAQEASGGDEPMHPGSDELFGGGGP